MTFLRDYRHHKNPSVGYVASGYWFGHPRPVIIDEKPSQIFKSQKEHCEWSVVLWLQFRWLGAIDNLITTGVFVSLAELCIVSIH